MPGAAAGRSPLSTSRAPRPERTAAGAPAKSQAKRMAFGVSPLGSRPLHSHPPPRCVHFARDYCTITGGHLHAPPSRTADARTTCIVARPLAPAPCSDGYDVGAGAGASRAPGCSPFGLGAAHRHNLDHVEPIGRFVFTPLP